MRSAIQHSHPRSASTASFGRVARRTPVPAWRGAGAPSANDAAVEAPPAPAARPDAQRLRAAARVHAFATLGRLIAAALRRVRTRLRARRDAARKRAGSRAGHRALMELDARTLRDIGLNRGELTSFAPDVEARRVRDRREH